MAPANMVLATPGPDSAGEFPDDDEDNLEREPTLHEQWVNSISANFRAPNQAAAPRPLPITMEGLLPGSETRSTPMSPVRATARPFHTGAAPRPLPTRAPANMLGRPPFIPSTEPASAVHNEVRSNARSGWLS